MLQETVDWNVFSNLISLKNISFFRNRFSGNIDWSVFTNLHHLSVLDLRENQFNGTIDLYPFKNMTNISDIWLVGNNWDTETKLDFTNFVANPEIRIDTIFQCDDTIYCDVAGGFLSTIRETPIPCYANDGLFLLEICDCTCQCQNFGQIIRTPLCSNNSFTPTLTPSQIPTMIPSITPSMVPTDTSMSPSIYPSKMTLPPQQNIIVTEDENPETAKTLIIIFAIIGGMLCILIIIFVSTFFCKYKSNKNQIQNQQSLAVPSTMNPSKNEYSNDTANDIQLDVLKPITKGNKNDMEMTQKVKFDQNETVSSNHEQIKNDLIIIKHLNANQMDMQQSTRNDINNNYPTPL